MRYQSISYEDEDARFEDQESNMAIGNGIDMPVIYHDNGNYLLHEHNYSMCNKQQQMKQQQQYMLQQQQQIQYPRGRDWLDIQQQAELQQLREKLRKKKQLQQQQQLQQQTQQQKKNYCANSQDNNISKKNILEDKFVMSNEINGNNNDNNDSVDGNRKKKWLPRHLRKDYIKQCDLSINWRKDKFERNNDNNEININNNILCNGITIIKKDSVIGDDNTDDDDDSNDDNDGLFDRYNVRINNNSNKNSNNSNSKTVKFCGDYIGGDLLNDKNSNINIKKNRIFFGSDCDYIIDKYGNKIYNVLDVDGFGDYPDEININNEIGINNDILCNGIIIEKDSVVGGGAPDAKDNNFIMCNKTTVGSDVPCADEFDILFDMNNSNNSENNNVKSKIYCDIDFIDDNNGCIDNSNSKNDDTNNNNDYCDGLCDYSKNNNKMEDSLLMVGCDVPGTINDIKIWKNDLLTSGFGINLARIKTRDASDPGINYVYNNSLYLKILCNKNNYDKNCLLMAGFGVLGIFDDLSKLDFNKNEEVFYVNNNLCIITYNGYSDWLSCKNNNNCDFSINLYWMKTSDACDPGTNCIYNNELYLNMLCNYDVCDEIYSFMAGNGIPDSSYWYGILYA